MSRHEKVRKFLAAWQLWTGIPYFVLLAVLGALYVQNTRLNHEAAVRVATAEASAEAVYHECTSSIPQVARLDAFFLGVQGLAESLLANSVAAHQAATPGSDLYRIQSANIDRLQRSVRLIDGLTFPIPTPAQCRARRDRALRGGA